MARTRTFWDRFFLVMTILTAIGIFLFSSQSAQDSTQVSDSITATVANIVRPDYTSLPADRRQSFLGVLSVIIRKCAHFSEFTLLGFNLTGFLCLRRLKTPFRTAMPTAWGLATLYACTDELHQMFVSERSPGILDVGIDSAGALTGVLVMALALYLLARKIKALR